MLHCARIAGPFRMGLSPAGEDLPLMLLRLRHFGQ